MKLHKIIFPLYDLSEHTDFDDLYQRPRSVGLINIFENTVARFFSDRMTPTAYQTIVVLMTFSQGHYLQPRSRSNALFY